MPPRPRPVTLQDKLAAFQIEKLAPAPSAEAATAKAAAIRTESETAEWACLPPEPLPVSCRVSTSQTFQDTLLSNREGVFCRRLPGRLPSELKRDAGQLIENVRRERECVLARC